MLNNYIDFDKIDLSKASYDLKTSLCEILRFANLVTEEEWDESVDYPEDCIFNQYETMHDFIQKCINSELKSNTDKEFFKKLALNFENIVNLNNYKDSMFDSEWDARDIEIMTNNLLDSIYTAFMTNVQYGITENALQNLILASILNYNPKVISSVEGNIDFDYFDKSYLKNINYIDIENLTFKDDKKHLVFNTVYNKISNDTRNFINIDLNSYLEEKSFKEMSKRLFDFVFNGMYQNGFWKKEWIQTTRENYLNFLGIEVNEVKEVKEVVKTVEEVINDQVAFKEEVIKNINFNLKYTANKNLDKRSFKTLKSVENNLNECLNKLYNTVDYCYNSNIINPNYDPQDLFNKYNCEFSSIIANYTVNLSYIEECLESNKFEFIRNFNYYYESYTKKLQCNNLNYDKEKAINYLEKLNNFCKQIKSYISEIWSITDKILKPFKEEENRRKEEKERIRKEEENRIKREEEEKERKSLKRKLNIKDYRDINTAKEVIMDASCFLHKDIKENKVNIKDIEKVISFYNCYFEKAKNYTNNFTKASYNKDYFSFVKSCNYYLKEIITKYNELTNNNFVLNTTDADYDTLYQKEREEYKRILEENRRKDKIREEKHKEYIKILEEKLDKINIKITEEKAIFDYLNNLEFENYRNKGYINRAIHHDIWATALNIEKKYNNKSYIICLQVYKCLNKYLGRKFNFTKQTDNDYNKYYLDYEKFDNVIHDFCGHANLEFFIQDLEKAVTILEADAPVKEVVEENKVKEVNTKIIKKVIITVLKSLVNTIEVKTLVKIIKIITKRKELLIIHKIMQRSRAPPEVLKVVVK